MSRPTWQQQAQQQQRYLQQRQAGIYTIQQQRNGNHRPSQGQGSSGSGIAGAVVGAVIGGAVAGPIGAVVGAVLGGIFSE